MYVCGGGEVKRKGGGYVGGGKKKKKKKGVGRGGEYTTGTEGGEGGK